MLRARVLSFIAWAVMLAWSRLVRIRVEDRSIPDGLRGQGKSVIYAFWHGRQFLLFATHRNSGIVIPASESRDGEIQAGVLARFGFGVVRGSSKRKGAQALLGLVDALRSGKNIALAVDGPRGPVYEVKQGITYLAGKLGVPIVPLSMSARRAWILTRVWDRYMLPVPFTRCVVLYGEPLYVRSTDPDELERKRVELAAAINATMDRADRMTGRAAAGAGA